MLASLAAPLARLALITALATPLVAAPTRAAQAHEVSGRAAIGGELAASLDQSAMSFKYWISDVVGFQGLLSLGIDDEADLRLDFGVGLRGLFNIARAADTHFYFGAGIRLNLVVNGDAAAQRVELLFGAEHFFGKHFSLSGQFGASFELTDPFRASVGEGGTFALGFHFYF